MLLDRPNAVRFRPLSRLKQSIVTGGRAPRRIQSGLLRGMVLELDLASETQVYLGLYERETFAFIRRWAPRCAWMIDVGAATGELAIYFAQQAKCRDVHAFEPRAEALRQFRRNLALNAVGAARLVIHDRFMGTDSGSLRLDEVPVPAGAPGFIKIDVDGFETDVLDSGLALLANGPRHVLIEVHSLQLEQDCIARLEGLGFAVEVIDNAWWRRFVPEHRPIEHNRWIGATRAA
jgi:precorrin-6B methylase 2